MDRSLDEIIGDRPAPRGRSRPEARRGPPPPSHRRVDTRREEYPRDGVRKNRYNDERVNLDNDWVHDRYDDERFERARPDPRSYEEYDRRERPSRGEERGAKIRVDNIHYELTETEMRELFERIAPVLSVRMVYDRSDRPTGTAFIVYQDLRDAEDAIRQFDGQNANSQPIRLTLVPHGPAAALSKGSLFERVERPARSLFDRIHDGPAARDDSREDNGARRRRGRRRSESPRQRIAPDNVDRYVPGERRGSRSPMRRRGTPRDIGRRPGQRREDSGRGAGGRRGRTDDEGRPLVGGRPRKTAQELDDEMADYWGKPAEASGNSEPASTAATNGSAAATGAAPTVADDDIDMIS